jgi:hypothetical protein
MSDMWSFDVFVGLTLVAWAGFAIGYLLGCHNALRH